MPKGSAELTQARKDEIIDACAGLYEHMNFRDITIKEIGRATSFTRTSIYNYYQTKEEIFLALLQREYALWEQDLCAVAAGEALSRTQLAQALAASLAKRSHMLKLLAMNLYDLEENSRMERLVDFKRVYGASIRAVEACLARLAPPMDRAEQEAFLYSFCPFVYGIYPYAVATEKQSGAMAQAQVPMTLRPVYEIALTGTRKLLGA
ncbi:MAG: TetR/AcrR family transcriptional regulator [Clostridiales bacterium]|nr:TetR/AcrR family transcriptional regulator [Clostridiales bacterium]MDY4035790.1 TetR/AcrR family transcriptional regulator [Candidatus Pseudoscilispira sp.]